MLNNNNMPGAGSIADTMEFMKKMWSSMGTPSIGIPTLSVEEINKKISDLKTVASWLELNMNMLRATIQTLEVQSATLSTLQAMGAILTPQASAADQAKAADAGASPFGFPAWPPKASAQPFSWPASAAPQDAPDAEPEDEPEDESDYPPDTAQAAPRSAQAAEPEAPDAPHAADAQQKAAAAGPDLQAAMANPNAWWNLLQEQFQQAVSNVIAEQEPPAKEGKQAKQAKAPKEAKTARSAAPKKTTKPTAAAKPGTRAKPAVVQSRHPKPAARKPKAP